MKIFVKKMIYNILRLLVKDPYYIVKYIRHIQNKDIIYNVNNTSYDKNCLFIYILEPFKNKTVSYQHQNQWQALEWAKVIGTYGYNVDVSDYTNPYVRPKNKYDMVLGLIPRNIDYYTKVLKKDGKLIAYMTSSNLKYSAKKEQERLDDLYNRKHIILQPERSKEIYEKEIEKKIEKFDAAFFIGNEYNLKSYNEFCMPPVSFIVNNGYKNDRKINYDIKSSKNFLFFGSSGMVHKGLDLLLDIFSKKDYPYNLYVCGGYENEKDFCELYNEELYHTKNIFHCGFLKVGTDKFYEIMDKCSYLLYPSCAEAQAGCVLTTMSFGVIPIVSKDSGYNDDVVINLPDCSINTIEKYIKCYADKQKDWIISKSKESMNIINNRFLQKDFTNSLYKAFDSVLK